MNNDLQTILKRIHALFSEIRAIAIAHEGLAESSGERKYLAMAIADLAEQGDIQCYWLIGQDKHGQDVTGWIDHTDQKEMEDGLGRIWPLFNQLAALALSYDALQCRHDHEAREKARGELADVINIIASIGIDEVNKLDCACPDVAPRFDVTPQAEESDHE
ncbi:hypothetical protein AGMMS50289_15790 [Betaproteobacteria bacterium]|nr:hypothetical protein AGMMS50289_15790 [Betaproteobacteria bacterium]